MQLAAGLPRRRARRPVALLVALISVVAFFGLLELALRATSFDHPPATLPPILWDQNADAFDLAANKGLHVASVRQLWAPRPGTVVPWGTDEHINAEGYRGPLLAREKRPGVLRIATLGDSSTFGMGVAWADTWAARLSSELAARGIAAEVLSGGVIGTSIEQGLERYDELIRGYAPDVVIASYGAFNDLNAAAGGESDRDKIESRSRLLAPRTAWEHARRDVRVFHLAAWVADRARGRSADAAVRAASITRGALARQEDFWRPDWAGTRRVSPERFEIAIGELARRVRRDGAKLCFISMPREPGRDTAASIAQVYSDRIARAAREHDIPLLDARARIRRELDLGRPWTELFVDAYHPSPAGHDILVHEIADLVARSR